MRYFDDGDLTNGLKTTNVPLRPEFLAGDYHIVWTFSDDKKRTLDWSSDLALSDWSLRIRAQEDQSDQHFEMELHFASLDLEYTLEYEDKTVNHLKLARNKNPGDGVVEDELMMSFSDTKDDQGWPYIRCSFQTNENDPQGDMENIEFVAKRTDQEGIAPLGLTKNERLRLGYPLFDDGTFEPEDSDEETNNHQNPDSLQKQLERHVEAALKIHGKMVALQNNINKQVANATNGMQQAMQQVWRSVDPATNAAVASFDGASPPPGKRRKLQGNAATASGAIDDTSRTPSRRQGGGPENTPISIEHDVARSGGSAPMRRKRGGGLSMSGGSGRGGKRKSMRAST